MAKGYDGTPTPSRAALRPNAGLIRPGVPCGDIRETIDTVTAEMSSREVECGTDLRRNE